MRRDTSHILILGAYCQEFPIVVEFISFVNGRALEIESMSYAPEKVRPGWG